MVEVPWIYRDGQKLIEIEHLLQDFRSLISNLEEVDPRKLNHEAKLAFWINVHNSLMMHAYLAYGIPQNNMKKNFLLLKAAYNIGGHTISIDTIQSSILGCRMPRPGQWLSVLLPSKSKFKMEINAKPTKSTGRNPFTFCTLYRLPFRSRGSCLHAKKSPAGARDSERRIHTSHIRYTQGQKVVLPKIIESFAKESRLCTAGTMEMIQKSLPESLRKNITKSQNGKSRKNVEWMPHNFTFRYLISGEIVK